MVNGVMDGSRFGASRRFISAVKSQRSTKKIFPSLSARQRVSSRGNTEAIEGALEVRVEVVFVSVLGIAFIT